MNTNNTYPARRSSQPVWQHAPVNLQARTYKKFAPASRHARIISWQQRMQTLFARQSY